MCIIKSDDIFQRDRSVIAPGQHLLYFPIVVDSVKDDIVIDCDGKSYIDFLSSASSLNLGGSNPIVRNAIEEQLMKCVHYCTCYSLNMPMVEYAERLISIYPGSIDASVFFTLSGSSASDMAFYLAKAYTKRKYIISFKGSYHGNTYASSNLSDMDGEEFPKMQDVYHFKYYYEEDCIEKENYVDEIEEFFANGISLDDVAAIFIEAVQGDGGLHCARRNFILQLYCLCKKHGILFICDEVQQGFFRSGYWFSIEHYGVVPDGIIMGKSLGAGFPLGAFVARKEIMQSLSSTVSASTIGGYQLACAAGIAQFDYMSQRSFRIMLQDKSKLFFSLSKELISKKRCNLKLSLSGMGFSYGIHVFDQNNNKDCFSAFKIAFRCYETGLLLISFSENVIRLQPPFSISQENLVKGFELLERAICDIESGYISDSMLYFYENRYPRTGKHCLGDFQ